MTADKAKFVNIWRKKSSSNSHDLYFSSVPDAVLWVEHAGSLSDRRTKDVPVQVISDPELLPWTSLLRVVVEYTFNELRHICLPYETDTATAPACTREPGAESTSSTAHTDKFVKVWARTIVELVAALVASVHQLSKTNNLLLIFHLGRFTGGLEVLNTLCLSIDMARSLLEEELSIL